MAQVVEVDGETEVREAFPELSDDELQLEMRRLMERRRELASHTGKTREDSHQRIDRTVEVAKQRVDVVLRDGRHRLATSTEAAVMPPKLADSWILAKYPEIAARWHEIIDETEMRKGEQDPFAPMTKQELDKERAEIMAAYKAREDELELRAVNLRVHEAQIEKSNLQKGKNNE